MKVTVGDRQYAPFGERWATRLLDAGGDELEGWGVIDALPEEARIEYEVQLRLQEERRRRGSRGMGISVQRAERNEEIARALGFDGSEEVPAESRSGMTPTPGDVLAHRLNSRQQDGTRARLEDDEFDELLAELGLAPSEARARFRGEQPGS